MEERDPGRENPGANRDMGTGRGRQGGAPDGGKQSRLARVTPLGRPEWEVITNNRWRPAGGIAVQVDGHSATGRKRGRGDKWVQRNIDKQRRQVKKGGNRE